MWSDGKTVTSSTEITKIPRKLKDLKKHNEQHRERCLGQQARLVLAFSWVLRVLRMRMRVCAFCVPFRWLLRLRANSLTGAAAAALRPLWPTDCRVAYFPAPAARYQADTALMGMSWLLLLQLIQHPHPHFRPHSHRRRHSAMLLTELTARKILCKFN